MSPGESSCLHGHVVVVTGGAGLLGRKFCATVAAHGGRAVVADRDAVAAARVANELALQFPDHVSAVTMDITEQRSIAAAIEAVRVRYGRIDAVVNNAYPRNRNYGRRMEDVTYADFSENMGMHVGGYFLVTQQFAAFFKQQNYGNIIMLSSIYGVIAPRFEVYANTTMTMPVEYAAIKAAVIHLTRYFAKYLRGSGIRVNALSPGGILDGQPGPFLESYRAHTGGKGMLDTADLQGAFLFLLSDASSYVNGQNLIVDDGFSL